MPPIETNDKPENPSNPFDTADLDARLSQAEDVQMGGEASTTDLSDLEQRVQQLQAETEASEAQQLAELQAQQAEAQQAAAQNGPIEAPQPTADGEPPAGHTPASASGERGEATRAETGAEKPEVKDFHPGGPEGGW